VTAVPPKACQPLHLEEIKLSDESKASGSTIDQTVAERLSADREAVRIKMANEVENFLKAGGKVEQVERGKRADPPRKPESQYGSRPI